MATFCACGKPATHLVKWNPWIEVHEPVPSAKRPSWCRACCFDECRRQTTVRLERDEYERNFNPAERVVYTSQEMPHAWHVKLRAAVNRHPEVLNPGGLVKMYRQGNVAHLELWPPQTGKERETWDATEVLYRARYLSRLPLVFREVDPDSLSSSPTTWREQSRRLADMAGPVTTSPPSSADETVTDGNSEE